MIATGGAGAVGAWQRLSAGRKKELYMIELAAAEVGMVSGGVMSTETKVEIGVALVLCPILGLGMLAGYYANTK